MTKTLFKLYTDRKDILDLADKMDCFTLIDKSRIDGSPIYQVELTTYQRILKIKKLQGKETGIYGELYQSLVLVSTLEDHINSIR